MSKTKKILACLLIAAWLLPIVPVGIFFKTATCVLPKQAAYFYNIGCLFSKTTKRWSRHYAEGQTADGRWIKIPHQDYFRINPFGHRKRFDRTLIKLKNDPRILGHLASWVRRRYNRETIETENKVKRVRLIKVYFESSPERPFPWPELEDVPQDKRIIMYEERPRLAS